MYEKERSKSVNSNGFPSEWTKENDEIYHKGIGLMHPSDYGYAVGGSVRKICLASTLSSYDANNCYKNNWLYDPQWFLLPSSSDQFSDNSAAFYLYAEGGVLQSETSNIKGVLPVAYLLPSIIIYEGDGSFENPFRLQNAS